MDEIAAATLPPRHDYGWTGVSYQEAALGNQSYWVFALALLLVLLVLAGQYESWSAPLAVVSRCRSRCWAPSPRCSRWRASRTTSTPRSASCC